ncbi:Polyisoprenoid-binding protein YceI [Daejeonella lutea]|uniref:Polyisoprenoid-binding protein YceI n=2 Tax=Daejeonella lutea TaxID=572036 RepID=A0A1T5CTQ0_9SPHI|nr:Polyisoprenoid-binding protein YceI [Daejeonella lutea]
MKMKKIFLTLSILTGMAVFMSFDKPVKDTIYTVDTERSTIDWTAKKVGGGHTGTIKITSGNLVHNGKSLTKGTFLINMASITSDNARVTTHLKSDDFFAAEKNPNSKFEITKVTPAGTDRVNIAGNLTIKGITQPISFPATVKTQKGIIVAVANGIRVDRTKYDIKFRSKTFFLDIGDRAVDDEFELNINLVAKK